MANIVEWIPFLALVTSIVGSVASFILSTRQRKKDLELVEAQTTEIIGSSYRDLLESYQDALDRERSQLERKEKELATARKKLNDCLKVVGKQYSGG